MDMAGGLNIKMKYIYKILILQMIVILMLGGCSQDMPSTKKAKLLIGFAPGMDFCLININENGTIEYTSCSINNADLRNENIVNEVYEKKTIRLSEKNKTIINELIQETLSNEPIKELGGDDFAEVRALIDDKVYLSVYYNEPVRYYDKNLANLSYKLVELSPIKVGGKQNSLEVPNK